MFSLSLPYLTSQNGSRDEEKATHRLKHVDLDIDEDEERSILTDELKKETQQRSQTLARLEKPQRDLPNIPQEIEEDKSDIIFKLVEASQGRPQLQVIKAATLDRLIERLTSDKKTDVAYSEDFLLTYRSFIEPLPLLEKLIERFGSQESSDNIKFRTVNVLKTWIKIYPTDFATRLTMNADETKEAFEKEQKQKEIFRNTFLRFIEGPLKNMDNLRNALNHRFQAASKSVYKAPQFESSAPVIRPSKGDFFIDWDVVETARQLTIIESKLYNSISIPF